MSETPTRSWALIPSIPNMARTTIPYWALTICTEHYRLDIVIVLHAIVSRSQRNSLRCAAWSVKKTLKERPRRNDAQGVAIASITSRQWEGMSSPASLLITCVDHVRRARVRQLIVFLSIFSLHRLSLGSRIYHIAAAANAWTASVTACCWSRMRCVNALGILNKGCVRHSRIRRERANLYMSW